VILDVCDERDDVVMNYDYLEDIFTTGDCWYFAFHLHKALKKRGIRNEIMLLGSDTVGYDCWYHVMVRLQDETYLDIRGPQDWNTVMKHWGADVSGSVVDKSSTKKFDVYRDTLGIGIVYDDSPKLVKHGVSLVLADMGLI